MTVIETKLLPCPFCGPGNSMVDPWFDDVSKRWAVGCGRCGSSSGRSVHAEGSKEAAIKSWNTRGLTAALSDQAVVPKASQGIVRTVGWIRNDDADPNDEDAVRFFGVVVEYPNEPPTFSPSIVWAKTPVCIVIAPPPSSTAGESQSG